MTRTYLTVSIPYVNARPHLGYALELVRADVLARSRRARGDEVRFLGGTDENSLKNVLAAELAGVPVHDLVAENAGRFSELASVLGISFDDFIRTSVDARHRPAVERLWQRCAAAGNLYRRNYEGRYCVDCEQFYAEADLVENCCPEHRRAVEIVAEENWFFRLSRYRDQLIDLLDSGALRIVPAAFANEVRSALREGLEDISVSRSAARARNWGIPVPGDPSQVIYVWFDALANYISALGYGTGDPHYQRWWCESDERIHFVGKGIVRFHAIYWPALLLSADEPLPTTIYVHPYLTSDGEKISKSSGVTVDPIAVANEYGVDALRWWLVRDVPPTTDADYRAERLVTRANDELANGFGNLIHRSVSMAKRLSTPIRADEVDSGSPLFVHAQEAVLRSREAADFDPRQAAALLLEVVNEANRFVEETRPWELIRTNEQRVRRLLATLISTEQLLAGALRWFAPELADRIRSALEENEVVPVAFARLEPRS